MLGLAGVAFFIYRLQLHRAKAIERSLKMVPILIHLPPISNDSNGGRGVADAMKESVSQAATLYNLVAGTAKQGFQSNFYGQRHVSFEIVASGGLVYYYVAVPVALVSTISKAVQAAYPGARLEESEDHNIFSPDSRLSGVMGGELVLRADYAFPISTYNQLDRDPLESIMSTLSTVGKDNGASIQVMIRPASPSWSKHSVRLAGKLRQGKSGETAYTPLGLLKAAVRTPSAPGQSMEHGGSLTNLEMSRIEAVEEKTKYPGFEVLIRVIVSTQSVAASQQLLQDISTAFALFERPGLNGFKFLPAADTQGLVTSYIMRFFPPSVRSNILNSMELATLFHLPSAQFTPMSNLDRQQSKQVDGPVSLPTEGMMFGYNEFRGVRKEIRLSINDRRRHVYILGQTGTGKSTLLENLAVQDMLDGNGFCFIDPHGDTAEKLISMVPKNRAEDVIYFNPGDTESPLGLNLFEFNDPAQKDFVVQETINMLYKLYDPGHTGIIGPRFEHWYRNAALTLMADPAGSSFLEIPKVFTDTEYLKQKFRYLKDPTVIDFWVNEMGQTSDYHKSEMLGFFVSKFGAFQSNEMMRNIIGQTKSSFNIREIMDNKKILIVNLSKGRVGELNSKLLGMIFVIKIQAAAMSRVDIPENDRKDFALYVDEFQNFSTDSFASILSEARKFRLNLIVANQFIGQLSQEIRDAVFGNIGTIAAFRMGPEDAEFMVKQFAPVFDASDLVNLPNFNTAMRLMVGGLPSHPFTMKCLPPLGTSNVELGNAIKQLSAAKFGRPRARVEAAIASRLATKRPAAAAPAPTAVATPTPISPAVTPTFVATATPTPISPAVAPEPTPITSAPAPVAAAAAMVVPAEPVIQAVAPIPELTVPSPTPNALTFRDITGDKPLPKPEETAASADTSAGTSVDTSADTKVSQVIEDVQLIKQPVTPLVASKPAWLNVVSETTKNDGKIESVEEPKIDQKESQNGPKDEQNHRDDEKREKLEQISSAKSNDHGEQVTERAGGGLILPQAKPEKFEEQETETVPPPHKIAPGEVYVDENGNVIVGE